jgi:hypothetical protein
VSALPRHESVRAALCRDVRPVDVQHPEILQDAERLVEA